MITVHFLAEWALRSSILSASGFAVMKILRVKDPAVRLAVCTAMLCGSLAVPLLTVSLPTIPVQARAIGAAPVYNDAPARVIPSFRPAKDFAAPEKHFDWGRVAVAMYGIVVGLLLLRLAIGIAIAARLLHRAMPTGLRDVRESDRVTSPATLGIVRPAIVLPADWREWSTEKFDAVLAHERAHIRRHDPAVQVLSAIHRALLWHSPLSWYLDRQIVRLAEQASDDAAVAAIHDRTSYAEMLLEFMRRGVRRANWQGVPMARYERPEARIDRILDGTILSRGVTRWGIAAIVLFGLPLAYLIAAAQEKLTFEAASVKAWDAPPASSLGTPIAGNGRNVMNRKSGPGAQRPGEPSGGPGTSDPGRIHYPGVTAKYVLLQAYGVNDYQLVGPAWLEGARYDIDATMRAGTTREQFRAMLQNLLIDRFQLAIHRETREFSGYSLVVGKSGPRFKEAAPLRDDAARPTDGPPGPDGYFAPPEQAGVFLQVTGPPGRADARTSFRQATMAMLADVLQNYLKRPVSDDTGLTASYDFVLNYSSEGVYFGSGRIRVTSGDGEPPHQPALAGAVQSQLGLKLESKKVSQEVIVVDHMEKAPTEN